MLSGWCGVVEIKVLGGSWLTVLELEAMNHSVAINKRERQYATIHLQKYM